MNVAVEFSKVADGIRFCERTAERDLYSHDIGEVPPIVTRAFFRTRPDLVVQPRTVEEIRRVLAFATEHRIPVVPRGAASWGFGGVIPTRAGIVVDLSPCRGIGDLDLTRKTVTVEAGARWSDIDNVARKQGLCLRTYPSSKFSTVGGWVATGGYGINSFKYGHLAEQLVSLTAVTASGEVKRLTPADAEFPYFVSTEGQFGIVVEVTLRLRDVPAGSFPHLLYFADDAAAFTFIGRLVQLRASGELDPTVIRFLDENHLGDANAVMRDALFKRAAGVLVEFDSADADDRFVRFLAGRKDLEEASCPLARYLWHERLFGMKAKRLGPTLLASEYVVATAGAADLIAQAKRIGRRFGVEVSVDAYVVDDRRTLVMATFLCDSRQLRYYVDLPLATLLTHAAVRRGAEPYGLGLWNAAFSRYRHPRGRRRELAAYKARVDPHGLLNPGKFFGVRANLASRAVFHPAVFGLSMNVLRVLSPVIGRAATLILGRSRQVDRLDFELSARACAQCGNCLAVCPAYLVTQNEAVTAKAKLALARKLVDRQPVTEEEAAAAFLCMHCRACEEICQVNLQLMDLWDALEARIGCTFGRPQAQIPEFLKAVDGSPAYWQMVERNN